MTKANSLMESHFKTSINASTPDEEDDYSTSNEADINTKIRGNLKNVPSIVSGQKTSSLSTSAHPRMPKPTSLRRSLVVFHPELCRTPTAPAKHGIYPHIKTTGPTVFTKFRCAAPDRLAAAKETFAEIEEMALCQTASSPWLSPLHIILKKDGFLLPCWDYRCLNLKTVPDHYTIPNIVNVTSYLQANVFSTLDLMKGYYQVPLNPEDIPKTTITTPFEMWFLGHRITPEEDHPLPGKVEAIQDFPSTTTFLRRG
ncbi:uncharacterized protein [Palaemon carinicauda]|uniref:uncharacterized protein n=1 Tax=Palaemon carinicauda TaxID=392227 RepID=UPI0035B63701